MSDEVNDAVATEEKVRKPRIPALQFYNNATPDQKVKPIKYPMPLKADRFDLKVNGQVVSAANTTFRDILYTYFEYSGASFYVPGHLDPAHEYTLEFPNNFDFTPTKMDRKITADKATAALKAKKATKKEVKAGPEEEPQEDEDEPNEEPPEEPKPAEPAAKSRKRAARATA